MYTIEKDLRLICCTIVVSTVLVFGPRHPFNSKQNAVGILTLPLGRRVTLPKVEPMTLTSVAKQLSHMMSRNVSRDIQVSIQSHFYSDPQLKRDADTLFRRYNTVE